MKKYIETTSVEKAAHGAAILEICEGWNTLMDRMSRIECDKVEIVNTAREMGLHLKGLCRHEQIRLPFFEHLKESFPVSMAERFDYASAKYCVKLANSLPEPVKLLAEAEIWMEPLFITGGFLELAVRTDQQQSRELTPVTLLHHVQQGQSLSGKENGRIKKLGRRNAPGFGGGDREV